MNLFTLVGEIVINYQDAEDDIEKITEKAETLSGKIQLVGSEADTTGGKLKDGSKFHAGAVWLGNTLTRLSEKAASLIGKLGSIGFEFNSSMEVYQNQFTALLQSEEKAQSLVKSLQELAKLSPLGMEGLAQNAVQLLNTGTQFEDMIPTLEMLGNISLGDPDKMDRVVTAYSQMMSIGKLKAQEIQQFINAGVPIIDLITKYGGPDYEGGYWYQDFLRDPQKEYVLSETVAMAMRAATAEGGVWQDYMFTMMDTYAGIMDRTKEEGKETLGAFFQPFFDVAEDKVLPKITESLTTFQDWITNNKDSLESLATSLGDIATLSFDALLGAFQWCVDHGEAVAVALGGISTALLVGAIAAHPYAAAVTAVVAGLAALTAAYEDHQDAIADAFMSPYANQESVLYGLAGKYAGWADELKEAAEYYIEAAHLGYNTTWEEEDLFSAARKTGVSDAEVNAFMNDVKNAINSADFTIGSEYLWFDENAQETLQKQLGDMELNAETSVSAPNAQAELQTEIDGTNLTATVDVAANYKMLELAASLLGTDGSHSSGLDYVPFDGYRAILHKGETVLNAEAASAWRNGQTGDAGRMEAALSRVEGLLQQIINNTGAGQTVVLDSGILVGQIAPQMDAQLGMIGGRRGRRN